MGRLGRIMSNESRITIRYPAWLHEALSQAAKDGARSLNQEIVRRLEESVNAERPAVVRWLDISDARRGELVFLCDITRCENCGYATSSAQCESCGESTSEDIAQCPTCDQDIDRPYVGILNNGKLYGPVCSACATSK